MIIVLNLQYSSGTFNVLINNMREMHPFILHYYTRPLPRHPRSATLLLRCLVIPAGLLDLCLLLGILTLLTLTCIVLLAPLGKFLLSASIQLLGSRILLVLQLSSEFLTNPGSPLLVPKTTEPL